MRKRRKALLWTLSGLSILIAVILVSTHAPRRDNQPVYKGLTLAQWLDVAARHRVHGYFTTYQKGRPHSRDATPEEIKEAEDAVRAIGTNALPCLLEWISYDPTRFRRFYMAALELLPFTHGRAPRHRENLSEMAVKGFAILNTNALPAAGDLVRLANDTNHTWSQRAVAKALLTVTNTPAR